MTRDSLSGLAVAFRVWRGKKRYATEKVPEVLMARASRAAAVYGVRRVAVALKVDQTRLSERMGAGGSDNRAGKIPGRTAAAASTGPCAKRAAASAVPVYSRLEIATPASMTRPLAEVETLSGTKLRIFTVTSETLQLVSALSETGRSAP